MTAPTPFLIRTDSMSAQLAQRSDGTVIAIVSTSNIVATVVTEIDRDGVDALVVALTDLRKQMTGIVPANGTDVAQFGKGRRS